jgi:hypothetical protein
MAQAFHGKDSETDYESLKHSICDKMSNKELQVVKKVIFDVCDFKIKKMRSERNRKYYKKLRSKKASGESAKSAENMGIGSYMASLFS